MDSERDKMDKMDFERDEMDFEKDEMDEMNPEDKMNFEKGEMDSEKGKKDEMDLAQIFSLLYGWMMTRDQHQYLLIVRGESYFFRR